MSKRSMRTRSNSKLELFAFKTFSRFYGNTTMTMNLIWCCVLVTLIHSSMAFSWSAMTIEVEPKAEECVYQILNKGDLFELEFEVVRGGLLDIEVIVKDPRESVMFRKLSFFNDKSVDEVEEEGYVSIDATRDGVYSICFNNRMSRWTPKTVSFAVPNNSHESGDKEIAKLEHLGPMVDSIIKITDMLDEVEQLQHYMRVREWTHRDSNP